MRRGLVMVTVAACSSGSSKHPDAKSSDAMPTGTAITHVVYLNFDGGAVAPGMTDATHNTSSLLMTGTTLTRAYTSYSDRQVKIDAITQEIETILAPYGIYIVTERPATGPYDMTMFTDDPASKLGSSFSGAFSVTTTDCNTVPSPLNFVFALSQQSKDTMTLETIAAIGIAAGIPTTKVKNDCMCLADTACGAATAQCTIGGAGTAIATMPGCATSDTTMDEGAKFLAAFGPR